MAEKIVNQQELFDLARKKEPVQSANCTSPHDKSIYQYDSIDTLVCQVLELCKHATELGLSVKYDSSQGELIIPLRCKECDES